MIAFQQYLTSTRAGPRSTALLDGTCFWKDITDVPGDLQDTVALKATTLIKTVLGARCWTLLLLSPAAHTFLMPRAFSRRTLHPCQAPVALLRPVHSQLIMVLPAQQLETSCTNCTAPVVIIRLHCSL